MPGVVVDDEDPPRVLHGGSGILDRAAPRRKDAGLDCGPMQVSARRRALTDALGLGVVLLVLLDLLRPSLLLLPTITAGGDTPCHYPTAVWFYERLLPQLRLHGWYPGAYLGQPLLLYYFPFPFLLMSALAPALRDAGRLQARHGGRRLPAAAPRVRVVPPHAARFPGAAAGRGGGARLPLRRGQPDLGRHDREHARRRVLVHLRRRLRGAVPRRAGAGADGRARPLAAGRGARAHLATPTATPCCGPGSAPPACCS